MARIVPSLSTRSAVYSPEITQSCRNRSYSDIYQNMYERQRLETFLSQEIQSHNTHARQQGHQDDAVKAVWQAIVWTCALDEFCAKTTTFGSSAYRRFRSSDACGQYVQGVRYAHNRAAHQATEVIRVVNLPTFPVLSPIPFFEITWRLITAFPPPEADRPDPRGEEAYAWLLQDQPVRFTFHALASFFKRSS